MGKTLRRARSALPFVLFVFYLAGCATVPTPGREADYELDHSSVQKVGEIAWVDPVARIAVVHLDLQRSSPHQSMASRNQILVETAKLERTDVQRGRSLGVRIVEGLPNVGDEVVLNESSRGVLP